MRDLNYNYVVFNVVEDKFRLRENGYYTICLRDLDNKEGIIPVYYPLQHKSIIARILYNVHNSSKINRYIKLPFKKIWWPYIFKNNFKTEKPICFVFIGRMPIDYVSYLKKKYPKCKTVLIYRDLRKVTERLFPNHPDNPVFDYQFTYDEVEAQKFGWVHFDEFESKIKVNVSTDYPESDVFFAGKAKNRLDRLMKAYQIFTNAGLKVKYYLTGVDKNDQKDLPGITYASSFMPYSEMLYHTVNSRCVLDINQQDAVGYTSRFLEAVMYNKLLISDNKTLTKSPFYNADYIQCINKVEEIDPNFIKIDPEVKYHYNGEFSPINLITRIDQVLSQNNAEY